MAQKTFEGQVQLPQGRVFQLPTELRQLYDGLENIGIGPRHIGGHIRKGEWYVEMGGPKWDYISYWMFQVEPDPTRVHDGRFTLIGPDINELPPETSIPFAWDFWIYGPDLTDEHTEYVERMCTMGASFSEGMMVQGGRGTIWLRLSKKVAPRHSFVKLAQVMRATLMTTVPLVEAVEIRLVIGTPEVGGLDTIRPLWQEARAKWEVLDAKFADLEDADVDVFYGCTICQTFAPNHVCVITPQRVPYCGILSYHGCKVICEIDPQGYTFSMPKGECLNTQMGEFTGVNDTVFDKSNQKIRRVFLNSTIKYPTTNCGCFEGISFYIPEVDGIGLVQRRYFGVTPLGIPFSKMAGLVSGGAQNHGFKGISVRGMTDRDFLTGDGTWERIVWVPKDLKQEIAHAIPEELYEKIATEEDAIEPEALKAFLKEKGHPITKKFWKDGEPCPLEVPMPGHDWAE
ncbi:MAG: CO dehydrogenase/CO-methylating acetyl-CoA synthase complex subunit beta [Chloroflexota bacterium]